MKIEYVHVIAFSTQLSSGNGAGVFIVPEELDAKTMLTLAAEVNQPISSFVCKTENPNEFRIRWFFALGEIKLCGHGAMAAASALYANNMVSEDEEITFLYNDKTGKSCNTDDGSCLTLQRDGVLKARKTDDGTCLTFALKPSTISDAKKYQAIIPHTDIVYAGTTDTDIIIHIASVEELQQLQPDIDFLQSGEFQNYRGIAITAKSEKEDVDFEYRFFFTRKGAEEDSVTGSIHTTLGPFWSELLDKKKMKAYQCSKKGGYLTVEMLDINQVAISGHSKIFYEATIEL